MPETISPREVEDLLFYKLKDLILEQSEGEWDDATIIRDAHHFANHLRPLMSPALASGSGDHADHSGGVTTMVGAGDHAELARLADDLRGPWLSRIKQNKAADALESLLAENAALREQHEADMAEVARAGQNLQSQRIAITEAERKLAEETGFLRTQVEMEKGLSAHNWKVASAHAEEAVGLLREWMGTWLVDADSRGESAIADDTLKFLSKEAERG